MTKEDIYWIVFPAFLALLGVIWTMVSARLGRIEEKLDTTLEGVFGKDGINERLSHLEGEHKINHQPRTVPVKR